MKYELMLPFQIRKAIEEKWPVVLSVGVLEYHAEHCAVGTDALIINKITDEVEKEINMVVMPPFYYGVSSHAVAVPENNGTINVNADALHFFARDVFKGLLRVGFRNIHVLCWHQSDCFNDGMPTDLAIKLAARESIFEFIEKEKGEGWWGNKNNNAFYIQHQNGYNPLADWIKFHPLLSSEIQKKYPADHAGKMETSMMMALCPETIDMEHWTKELWYAAAAEDASVEYGNSLKKVIIESLRLILKQ